MIRKPKTSVARMWRTLVLGTAFLALTAPTYAQRGHANRPRVDRVVEKALRNGSDISVIVRYKNAAAGERLKKVKAGKGKLQRQIKSQRVLTMKVNHRALRELMEDAGVEAISFNAPVTGTLLGLLAPPPPPPATSVDGSGSKVARSRYDVTGAGVTVAIIDSGVKPHTDLPVSRITTFVDFVNGKTTPYDDYGHGTHVAGIVAGSGAASSGKYTGVAPGASIVALKVLDANGGGTTSNVMAALDWVLTNHATYGIRVVNLSLGHPIYESAATDPMVQMVEQLTQRGVVVAVSAGNSGRNALGQTVYGSITSPANAQGAITVGAADTRLTDRRSDDSIASFSSRGPTRIDRFVKPDVLAPGYQVASLLASGSTLANKYPSMQIGSSYFRLNGTSMAAPVAAGTAALLLQANPGLPANTVKGILQFTAQRLSGLDLMTQGAGELNVAGAVRFAKMVKTDSAEGSRWVMTSRKPVSADLLFGETAYWGRALVFRDMLKGGTNSLYMHLAQWNDNLVWGMLFDNIVWSMDENIVWGMFDNIVWGMLIDDNIVWGMNDDNIVWGFDDSVNGLLFDNIVWSMDDNIVWGFGTDTVQAFSEDLLGQSFADDILSLSVLEDAVDGESILIEGEVR